MTASRAGSDRALNAQLKAALTNAKEKAAPSSKVTPSRVGSERALKVQLKAALTNAKEMLRRNSVTITE